MTRWWVGWVNQWRPPQAPPPRSQPAALLHRSQANRAAGSGPTRINHRDQDQDWGPGSGPTIRIRIEDQELDQADLNCRIEACDHLKGQFERSRSWLLPLWDDTGANGSQTKWPVICMEVGPELCKTVKGKQQRLKSCGDKVKMLLGKTQLLCSFGFPGECRKIQQFYVANTFTKYFSAKKDKWRNCHLWHYSDPNHNIADLVSHLFLEEHKVSLDVHYRREEGWSWVPFNIIKDSKKFFNNPRSLPGNSTVPHYSGFLRIAS